MNYLMIGAMLGCFVVILGAFGAHGLKDILDDVFSKGGPGTENFGY